MAPRLSQLLVNAELSAPNLNGLWHCRLNVVDISVYDEQINVGIFSRGGGS